MRFEDLSVLVDYVCSGRMARDGIPTTVVKLKAAKTDAMQVLRSLPDQEERRDSFCQLTNLLYRLYDARFIKGRYAYGSTDILAIMLLNYSC